MGATFPCLMLWSMWATQSLTQSHIQCAQPARAWIALRSYRHAYTNTNEHWTHTHTARSYIVRQPHTNQRPNGCWNAVMLVRLVHVWFTSFGYSIIESHTHTYKSLSQTKCTTIRSKMEKKTKPKNSGRDACVFASPDGRKAIAVDVYFSSINFKSFWYNICLFVCLFIVQRCIYSMFPYFDEFIMYIRSEQRATWQNHTVLQLFLFLFFFLYLQIDWMAYWHMQCTLKQKQNIL